MPRSDVPQPGDSPGAQRLEVVVAVLRLGVYLVSALTLTEPLLEHPRLPVLTHALLATAAVGGLLVVRQLRSARALLVAALVGTAWDLGVFAAYTATFAHSSGADGMIGLLALLLPPLRWGWRAALVSGPVVGLVAVELPPAGSTAATLPALQVAALVAGSVAVASLLHLVVRRSGARLQQAQAQFATAFQHASIGMALLDQDGLVLQANRALATLLGRDEQQLVGSELADHVRETDRAEVRAALRDRGEPHPGRRLEVQVVRPDGSTRWGLVAASFLPGVAGVPARVVVQVENTTERRLAEDRLSHQAAHDALTGLPNRTLLRARLELALSRREPLALLFLDLDRFKVVNDSLGHAAGDRLLCEVADRLTGVLRPGDLVARFGGDEFVLLCHGVQSLAEAGTVGERVSFALTEPVLLPGGSEVVPTASLGIALSDGSGALDDPDDLLRDADTAMYEAKAHGGGRAQQFHGDLRTAALRTHQLEVDLRRALRAGDLRLVHQPVVDLTTGRVVAFEALARWRHPERGPVPPQEFVAVAEQSDLIRELGSWVLRRSLEHARSWLAPVTVCVNVSPRQLLWDGFPREVAALLDEAGLPASRLCLEITETALVADTAPVIAALSKLRALGVRLAIDDFGTGHASLTYLARFPVDIVKVDRTFVQDVETDPGSAAIVGGVAAMSHAFGMVVVAEGVEASSALATLADLGCDRAQGYALSRPVDPEIAAGPLSRSRLGPQRVVLPV